MAESTCFKQVSDEAVVGVPYTAKLSPLPLMALPSFKALKIWKFAVIDDGAVTENVNVDPKLLVVRPLDTAPPLPVVGVLKSDASPVVLPLPSLTVIVQSIASLTRTLVEPLVRPRQLSCDATVGTPYTASVRPLPLRAVPLTRVTNTRSEAVGVDGAVKTNVKVTPPFVDATPPTEIPLAFTVGTPKSVARPVVLPTTFRTEIVQPICSLTRTVPVPLTAPTQTNCDAAVGLPYTVKLTPLPINTPPALNVL